MVVWSGMITKESSIALGKAYSESSCLAEGLEIMVSLVMSYYTGSGLTGMRAASMIRKFTEPMAWLTVGWYNLFTSANWWLMQAAGSSVSWTTRLAVNSTAMLVTSSVGMVGKTAIAVVKSPEEMLQDHYHRTARQWFYGFSTVTTTTTLPMVPWIKNAVLNVVAGG